MHWYIIKSTFIIRSINCLLWRQLFFTSHVRNVLHVVWYSVMLNKNLNFRVDIHVKLLPNVHPVHVYIIFDL